jgi:hypothetical protein
MGQPADRSTFPKSEREQAGVGYVDMLKELGAFGAFVGFGLVIAQLGQGPRGLPRRFGDVATVVVFALVTKSFSRILLAVLIVIMMPLAVTEIGTDMAGSAHLWKNR